MALITCDNVRLSYEGRCVLHDLSFSLERGHFLCVIGENGSGKSTLLKALLGLKAPDGGSISFGDGLSRREVGYLPQSSGIARDFPASVWEIVLSGCQMRMRGPFYSSADRARARETLTRFGMADLAHRSFRELSGGQQQRVLLCRALCAGEDLLLLDEPSAGLDPLATAELYAQVREANARGTTVLMVTHDVETALRDASHVLHLAGEPLYFGTVDGWRDSPAGRSFAGGVAHV